MNALKAFVVIIGVLFSITAAKAATVVTVSVMPGQFVGLADGQTKSGIYRLNVGGQEMFAMSTSWVSPLPAFSIESRLPSGSTMTMYTQDDVIAGASAWYSNTGIRPVMYTPELYSRAALFFAVAVGDGHFLTTSNPTLYAASFNEMFVNTLLSNTSSTPIWDYSNRVYDPQTGEKLIDLYNFALPLLNNAFDYRPAVILNDNQGIGGVEFMAIPVTSASTLSTPLPPAVWLFGSGLFGLAAVARRKIAQK